jgi:N-acetylglucosaminyldiphosphoundecaprenol N-acetyl-beta-D-mannosaminyltransferase
MREERILGIRFFQGSASEAVECGKRGGLVVAPSAPVLERMAWDPSLRQAVVEADMALPDSGLMVLMWRLLTGKRLTRVSGLEYLDLLLRDEEMRMPGALFWVMPSAASCEQNLRWLQGQGVPVTPEDCYLAPQYAEGEIIDEPLMDKLREHRPRHVILTVGGGVQERLGRYLRSQLEERPGIHCIGAAIGFLSGNQVRIPPWADYFYLGWFFRCLYQPGRFMSRYWKALRLIPLMIRYRENCPA